MTSYDVRRQSAASEPYRVMDAKTHYNIFCTTISLKYRPDDNWENFPDKRHPPPRPLRDGANFNTHTPYPLLCHDAIGGIVCSLGQCPFDSLSIQYIFMR